MNRIGVVAAFVLLVSSCDWDRPDGSRPPAWAEPRPTEKKRVEEKPVDDAALLAGSLPAGPERDMLQSRCVICHSLDYVTQQRLTAAQWTKTITKMQTFGAPILDDEIPKLSTWLSASYRPELADAAPKPLGTP